MPDMSELPQRKPTRWSEIDYSTKGIYFITICTQDRKQILSRIEEIPLDGAPLVDVEGVVLGISENVGTPPCGGRGALDGAPLVDVGEGFPLPHLTTQGKITQKYIEALNKKYPHITVDTYVIMPNHIHLILIVGEHNGRGNPSPTISSAVGWMKYHITKEINTTMKTHGQKIFQRSFYDHVIRNGREYEEIVQYIAQNPQNWQTDSLYC